jgi:hypothetical protein
MNIPAIEAFNEIVFSLKDPGDDVDNIEEYIVDLINAIFIEFEEHISEWTSNYHNITGRDTTNADTLFFNQRKIVIAYKYLFETARYIHIVVALMKDCLERDLSIRKAIFVYDTELQMIFHVENEIPEV